jgi:VanZ family protein
MLKQLRTVLHEPGMRRRWGWLWAALCVAVAVAALAPGDVAPTVTASDKVDHLLSFAALAAAGLLALAPGRRGSVLAASSMLAYGVLIELLQTQIPGRYGDVQDAVADAVGVALGVALITALRWLVRLHKQ